MKKVIALGCDGEFTGFDKMGSDLIKWAFVEILEDFTLGREMDWELRAYSTKYFTKGAEDVHGISYWRASQFPERIDSLREIYSWAKELPTMTPLVFHGNGNLDPDWLRLTFLKEEIESHFFELFGRDHISTLKLSRKHLLNLPNHKLNTICDHYGIELDHHDSLSDARAAAQIYCRIMEGLGTFTGVLPL